MSSAENNSLRTVAIHGRELADAELSEIRDSLRGLRYGVVEIVVQDGVIVQINRTEKRRLSQHMTRR